MAGTGLLLLLDDIASVLDDVAILAKVATRKTAGVLGDDLALNAQQVAGVRAERELPVVWAVAKGSFVNKAILVPAALAISAVAPWAITPLLMIGGAYLCFEGFEKLAHRNAKATPAGHAEHTARVQAIADPEVDLVAFEKGKIKGAIRTDFILSAEIIIITLGTVGAAAFGTQVAVLVTIAVLMTVGVYGLVAAIVKIDDAGIYLSARAGEGAWARLRRWTGRALLLGAPWLMKTLSVLGTAAMFLVGGGIIAHGLPFLTPIVERMAGFAGAIGGVGPLLEVLVPILVNAVVGLLVGGILFGLFKVGGRFLPAAVSSH